MLLQQDHCLHVQNEGLVRCLKTINHNAKPSKQNLLPVYVQNPISPMIGWGIKNAVVECMISSLVMMVKLKNEILCWIAGFNVKLVALSQA